MLAMASGPLKFFETPSFSPRYHGHSVLLLAHTTTAPLCRRSFCTSRIRVPRLVRSIFLWISKVGRIPSTIYHTSWTDWRVLRLPCYFMECSLVGGCINGNTRRDTCLTTVLARKGKERCRRPPFCNRRCYLSRTRLVHLSLLNQHFLGIVRQRSTRLLLG